MKLTTIAAISLFASCLSLSAQTSESTQTETRTTTSTVNLTGTLVDQGCYTTQTHRTETTTSANNATTTTETTRSVTECPVTTTTTSFGLITPEGRYVRFDDSGNTRVVEMVRSNKDWNDYIVKHKPVKVRVVGTPDGDVMVVKEIH
jgi:hypothetical protein